LSIKKSLKENNITIAVIPAYNEEKNIRKVIEHCKKYVHKIIVIDDGSTDNIRQVIQNMDVITIRKRENRGKTEAIRSGFVRGLKEGADIFILLDADGQHDPAEIPYFSKKIQSGFDLVIGARKFDRSIMPVSRILANSISSYLVSMICGIKIEDSQSGYRALRKEVVEKITLTSKRFQVDTEMIIKAVKCGFKVGFVPIKTIYHYEAKSKVNQIIDPLKFIMLLIKLAFWKCKE